MNKNSKDKDILSEIIANKRFEIDLQKRSVSALQLEKNLTDVSKKHSMRAALINSDTGIIAEFKRRSPSKGWINRDAQPVDIIPSYQEAGAAALSILTDEKYFGGNLRDIRSVRPLINIPILRKDFVVDEYQLYQAKIISADAVLLIASALTQEECNALAEKAHGLGLETLLEIHNEKELVYVNPHIDMVGVNNRNLSTFHTDVENSFRLAALLPKDIVLVSESGISQPDTVKQLRKNGFRGFLIGETFMKTDKPAIALADFVTQLKIQ
ncbi:indole-3-glycerol phosphate synthase TrpC [Bacteroides sp. 214]|uniref:indole-3-glycerol phosphate synthase TrpC n=1 Tax=Bacteroides sp. 214 TaxID=2302935 RepID=UPI0013D642D8|nr:indole-3-glycerol phosphate synthase TrpC [Bacteroides sp. 214]NDW12340.1 indole-3-glycerol phosphate synthase TrpC [Bacteroides sp. 214]